MSTLSYGLNITKKSSSLASRPPPAKRKTIFDDDSGGEDGPDKPEDEAESITTVGGLALPSPSKPSHDPSIKQPPSETAPTKPATKISPYSDLSTNHSTNKHATAAQSLDPSIYDYDSIYDSLHAPPPSTSSTAAQKQKSQYMSNLLAAAEQRKRDQLRAKDKLLAKERIAEGDTFDDKEKFVTEAYKKQQEEVRQMEEEEERRVAEEQERKRRGGGGMRGVYEDLLRKGEERYSAVVKAVEEGRGKDNGEGKSEEVKSEIEEAKEKGAVLNDDGQIIDHRSLLSAGLNVKPKPKPSPASSSANFSKNPNPMTSSTLVGRGGSKQAMRERQSRMLEAQLEQVAKRAADDDDLQKEEMEKKVKSRKTVGEIMGAKERYLARKREADAKTAGKAA